MADQQQSYANHTRWNPAFHFVLAPLTLINLLWCLASVYRHPDRPTFHMLLVGVILVLGSLVGRTGALKAQDRVIRLEERLRYQRLLSGDLLARSENLAVGQMIALRFASDAELPGLVQQVLEGKLTTSKEIKMAIQNWKADWHRV